MEIMYRRLLKYKLGGKKATDKIFNQKYIIEQVRPGYWKNPH